MSAELILNEGKLHIFHEVRKRRIYVGELNYLHEIDKYELVYDDKYVAMRNAIPLSPELDLFKKRHLSKKGILFSVLQDRIPPRENPAYEDYCTSQGISIEEKNPIILLGTIGKQGPSSFIFEFVYESKFSIQDIKKFRSKLDISQNDFSLALGISKVTLQKIETGESTDLNTMKLIQIFVNFPEVALWQLKQSRSKLHASVAKKFDDYFPHE